MRACRVLTAARDGVVKSDLTGKSLLVLGCGYLGIRLVELARSVGLKVRAVSRNSEALGRAEELGAETFCGLVDESKWHRFAGEDVDFVVNCVSSAGGGLAGYRKSYIEGNRSLCKWAQSIGFRGRAIYTSSVSVYPDAGGAVVGEDFPERPSNERGKLVLESERIFFDGVPQGARAFVLRLAGLYGPGRHLMLDSVRQAPRELPGWGDYYLNLARIEDVVSAVWECLWATRIPGGRYNVVDDESALKSDIVEWIARQIGVEAPGFTGLPASSAGASRRLGESGPPANRRVSNARLKEVSAWRPRYATFREGFGELIDRAEGKPVPRDIG